MSSSNQVEVYVLPTPFFINGGKCCNDSILICHFSAKTDVEYNTFKIIISCIYCYHVSQITGLVVVKNLINKQNNKRLGVKLNKHKYYFK